MIGQKQEKLTSDLAAIDAKNAQYKARIPGLRHKDDGDDGDDHDDHKAAPAKETGRLASLRRPGNGREWLKKRVRRSRWGSRWRRRRRTRSSPP